MASLADRLPSFNHYVGLAAGLIVMSACGTFFLFGVFSAQLRQVLGLGNVEINFVPTMMVIGSATSLDAGLFYEKFGPTPTALVGGLLFFFGYFMMFLSMLQLFVIPGWVVAIFGFFVGHGGSWAYTVALGTNLRNFSPGDRGKIVGIMTGNVALSGAIFTQFYKGFFYGKTTIFVLFLAVVPAAIFMISSILFTLSPQTPMDKNRISYSFFVSFVVAIGLGICNVITATYPNLTVNFWASIIIIVLFASYFLIVIKTEAIVLAPKKFHSHRHHHHLNFLHGSHFLENLSQSFSSQHFFEKVQRFLSNDFEDDHALAAGAISIRPSAKISVDHRRVPANTHIVGKNSSETSSSSNQKKTSEKVFSNDEKSDLSDEPTRKEKKTNSKKKKKLEDESIIVGWTSSDESSESYSDFSSTSEEKSQKEEIDGNNTNVGEHGAKKNDDSSVVVTVTSSSSSSDTDSSDEEVHQPHRSNHKKSQHSNSQKKSARNENHQKKKQTKHHHLHKQIGIPYKKTQPASLDVSLRKMLQTKKFWLLFVIYFFTHGAGNAGINSVTEMVYARHPNSFNFESVYSNFSGNFSSEEITSNSTLRQPLHASDYTEIGTFIVLFSVFNSCSRFFASDKFNHYLAAPTWVIIAPSMVSLAHVCFAFGSVYVLYLGYIFLGIGYGLLNCYMPYLVGKLFGPKHFPGNWALFGIGPALSTVLFSTVLNGKVADYFQGQQHTCVLDASNICKFYCFGEKCFLYSSILQFSLVALCVPLAVYFWWLVPEIHGGNKKKSK